MAMYWVTGLHFRYHGRGFNVPEVLRGEEGRGCRSAGSLKNPAAGDVSVTSYSCDFMLFPEPPRLLTSSTTISGPQIADAQQHGSCRKMTPTQPSAAKSSLLGIDKLAELSMAKSIRRLFHQIFSWTSMSLAWRCLLYTSPSPRD